MGTNRNIGRNNVVFDILRPSCRKRDDSQRKHTNLFFILAVFAQCSHPDFHPSVSVSLCEDLSLDSVSPVLLLFLFIYFFSPKVWFDLTLGVLHRDLASDVRTQIWSHAASPSPPRTVEMPYSVYIFCDVYSVLARRLLCSHAFLAPDALH